MEATKSLKKLEDLPNEVKTALRTFLNDSAKFEILADHLKKTPIVIDDGRFQISIRTVEELYEIIETLNELYS